MKKLYLETKWHVIDAITGFIRAKRPTKKKGEHHEESHSLRDRRFDRRRLRRSVVDLGS